MGPYWSMGDSTHTAARRRLGERVRHEPCGMKQPPEWIVRPREVMAGLGRAQRRIDAHEEDVRRMQSRAGSLFRGCLLTGVRSAGQPLPPMSGSTRSSVTVSP